MSILISSTPSAPSSIELGDIGIGPIATPFSNIDIVREYGLTMAELQVSQDLQNAIDNGYLSISVDGVSVSNISNSTSKPIKIVIASNNQISTTSRYYKILQTLSTKTLSAGQYQVTFQHILGDTKKKRSYSHIVLRTPSIKVVIGGGMIYSRSRATYPSSYADINTISCTEFIELLSDEPVSIDLFGRTDGGKCVVDRSRLIVEQINY